jgi:PIN domain nuclease of toxin-antitoxin system
MKLLLDTCVLLWLMMDSRKISPTMREVLANPMNQRYLSAVSVWEITVKWQNGKLNLPVRPAEFIEESKKRGRIRPLPLEDAAILQLPKLPKVHTDPFDRMLICQAIESGMTFVTPDASIREYPIKILWLP